jgi:hypothetical protein
VLDTKAREPHRESREVPQATRVIAKDRGGQGIQR